MYASTVEIKPSRRKGRAWEVSFSELEGEREDQESISGLGFYHYNRERGEQAAFEILKQHLVERHEAEIDRLKKSLISLKNLESGLKSD